MNQIKFSASKKLETIQVSIYFKNLEGLIEDIKINLKKKFKEWVLKDKSFSYYYSYIVNKYGIDNMWINRNYKKESLLYRFNNGYLILTTNSGPYSLNLLTSIIQVDNNKSYLNKNIITEIERLKTSLVKKV
tara:strand:- start:82 stop:477 length:396 start_codon:yes stop_codon:yes gene_type:complete